tara:strand:+ start:1109 stop:2524 length:1416 start_codon:yes stop_codon:yes gene_type:complete
MISGLRNFAKTKFAGVLVFIMIIPFVFWGMGGMFSSGNSNTLAKINETNISTKEFIDYLNNSGIPQQTIRDNLDNNIIEELLSGLISTTLLELEVKDYKIIISENTLFKKIKNNINFSDEDGNFKRMKYEKFLLENNQSAPAFELKLRGRELQKNLFDYIGAGTVSPKFLVEKLYREETKKLDIEFLSLENFYKKKTITENELKKFIEDNKDNLKEEFIDFRYAIINPLNLIGVDEFNQSFFDKIDQIEIDISNEIEFENIVKNLDISSTKVSNFKFSKGKKEIEQKIFELRNNSFDIFESGNDFIIYKIDSIDEKTPDLTDNQTKEEITELISQKNKFEFNKDLIDKINNNEFNDKEFIIMGKNNIQKTTLNSIRDNNKFTIDAVKILYSLPLNSFTLINDEKNRIYLAKIKKFINKEIKKNDSELKDFIDKQNSNAKNSILKSYDLYLNDKYNVVLNQKTIERVKNFFQ